MARRMYAERLSDKMMDTMQEVGIYSGCGCQDEQDTSSVFLNPKQISWLTDMDLFVLLQGLCGDLHVLHDCFSNVAYGNSISVEKLHSFFLKDYMQCRILISELDSHLKKL